MCFDLPRCDLPSLCDSTDISFTKAYCQGYNAQGQPAYTIGVNVINPPAGAIISVSPQNGIITHHTQLFYNMPDAVFGIKYVHTATDLIACYRVNFFNADSMFICYTDFCDTLPSCGSIPVADSCIITRTAEWMYCLGTDQYNNRLYLFEATVTTTVAYDIFAYSAQGGVYTPVMALDTGFNQVIGLFIDSMPYDSTVTIIFNALHPDSLTLCYFEVTYDSSNMEICSPPRYMAPGMTGERVDVNMSLKLIPNPARESTSIVYKFNSEAENRIYIMDMQGRIIKTFDNLTRVGALQYNTADLPNGIYFVVAQSKNNLKLAEKLVIIK
jgi:hypothetical protein